MYPKPHHGKIPSSTEKQKLKHGMLSFVMLFTEFITLHIFVSKC